MYSSVAFNSRSNDWPSRASFSVRVERDRVSKRVVRGVSEELRK